MQKWPLFDLPILSTRANTILEQLVRNDGAETVYRKVIFSKLKLGARPRHSFTTAAAPHTTLTTEGEIKVCLFC